MRIHHILIIVNFWCFEIIKRLNLGWLFVWSEIVYLLLIDELFIVAYVVEDAGDARELELGFDSYGVVVNWCLFTKRTFILLNSRLFIGSLTPLHFSGSTPTSLRLAILLLREVSDCLISSMRTGSAYGSNCILDYVYAWAVDSISWFRGILSLFDGSWSHTICSA